jgi:hypothetical protein
LNGRSPKYCQDGPNAHTDTNNYGNFVRRLSNFPLVGEEEIKSNVQMRLNSIKIQPFTGTNDPINPFAYLRKLKKLAEEHEVDLFTLAKEKNVKFTARRCINHENYALQINLRAQEPKEPL